MTTLVSLRPGVIRAAFASLGAQTVGRVLSIGLSVATARALSPAEVGVLGLAVIIVSLQSAIGACIETGCLTLHGFADRRCATAAAGLRAGLTVVMVVTSVALLPSGARLLVGGFDEARVLERLVQLLLILLVVEAATTFPRVLLQRRLDLTFVNAASLTQVVAHVGLSLVALAMDGGVVGLAIASLAGAAVVPMLLWWRLFTRWPPMEPGDAPGLWRAAGLASTRVSVGVVAFLNTRLDNALVAAVAGPAAMSFYAIAWTGSRLPVNLLGSVLDFVLLPTLARIHSDPARIGRALGPALRHYYTLLAPLAAGLLVSAGSVVAIVLGPRWLPAVPGLQVMSATIMADPLIGVSRVLLTVVGQPHLLAIGAVAQLIALALFVPPLTLLWGVRGAAIGDLLAVAILTCVVVTQARRAAPSVRYGIAGALVLPIGAAAAAGAAAAFVGSYLPLGWWRLASETLTLGSVYVVVLWRLGGITRLVDIARMVRDLPSGSTGPGEAA